MGYDGRHQQKPSTKYLATGEADKEPGSELGGYLCTRKTQKLVISLTYKIPTKSEQKEQDHISSIYPRWA